jgi:hypothetical protein
MHWPKKRKENKNGLFSMALTNTELSSFNGRGRAFDVVIVPVLIEHFHLVIKRLLAKPITVGDGTQNAIITTAPLNKICRLSMALFAIRLQKPIRLNQHQPEGHC